MTLNATSDRFALKMGKTAVTKLIVARKSMHVLGIQFVCLATAMVAATAAATMKRYYKLGRYQANTRVFNIDLRSMVARTRMHE